MTIFARVTVTEQHGIRRFLYPVSIDLPIRKNETLDIAVKDEAGNLLPCESFRTRNRATVTFAVSLEPHEKRRLTFFRSEARAFIPDPISVETMESGATVCTQERLTTTLLPSSDLGSVVYDGIEHLAGPVTFTLNAEAPDPEIVRAKASGKALGFQTSTLRHYPANDRFCRTDIRLTACKSWAELSHIIDTPAPGSIISLDIPLSGPDVDQTPVCDFGLGNGIYSKIDGDEVLLEADFYGKKPYCCWQISRLTEGIQRVDYQGDALTIKALSETLYLHWTLPNRSLALAVTELPITSTHVQVQLGRNGRIHLSVVLGELPARMAKLGVVLHFLNDVPPIAAATNPASILCPPKVVVKV